MAGESNAARHTSEITSLTMTPVTMTPARLIGAMRQAHPDWRCRLTGLGEMVMLAAVWAQPV